MKLLTKTSLYYFLFSIMVYAISVVFFYFVIQHALYEDVEENIEAERGYLEKYIQTGQHATAHNYLPSNFKVQLVKDLDGEIQKKAKFKDTLMYDPQEEEIIPFKMITFYTKVNNRTYKASIYKSLVETEDLIEAIMGMFVVTLLLLLFLLFFFTKWMSKRLWNNFYESLSKVKSFDLTRHEALRLPSDKISEFDELNQTINKMTAKIKEDYENLKQFAENSSHEIQTPLAVINNNIELLIQAPDISPENMGLIKEIYQSTSKISKLHQALLLLSKIENNQFVEVLDIDLCTVIDSKLDAFEEMLTFKNIRVEQKTSGAFKVKMNPLLADILVGNLLNNAIKHNQSGGIIVIEVFSSQLIFQNTGEKLSNTPDELFERFRKGNQSSESLGLGLAIVKQIVDNCGLSISYSYQKDFHSIAISRKI